jgi:hypothetical protein
MKKRSSNSTEIFVNKEKYLEIIGFTSYAYLAGKITKYSGMAGGRTRTLGEFIENFIYGKIAEEAFKLFLRGKFGLQTLTEVDVADFYQGIYLPDVVALKKNTAFVPLNFWIDVKEVRRDQKWLLVPASSVRQRPYDTYVAVWVGLPEEHVLWLVKNVPEVKQKMRKNWLEKVGKIANNIDRIPCKISGFALWGDVRDVITAEQSSHEDEKVEARKNLTKKFGENGAFYFDGKTSLFDPENSSWQGAKVGENVGFVLKKLEKSSDWEKLVSLILKNKRMVPKIPLLRTKNGALSKKGGLPPKYGKFPDYRNAFQAYFSDQLKEIRKKFGRIERTTSWFAQPF